MIDDAADRRFMAAALAIGRQGAGLTSPNPSVGCALVATGGSQPVIVGLAHTAPSGRPHAERRALAQAGERARGATAYVTLEPCSHHGRSPPCVDALIEAGVARVVAAAGDPNPLVEGTGYARLRAAGIDVKTGVLRAEAERDLAGHLTVMRLGRPHVTLKLAVSAEGAIGRKGEGQIAISNPLSRRRAHLLRAQSDAIAVGVGTVLTDDPRLTCRLPGLADRSPRRVVFDRTLRTPNTAAMLRESASIPVTVVYAPGVDQARADALSGTGAALLEAPSLAAALTALAGDGVMTLLLEGGATLADAFLDAGLIDRVIHIQTATSVPPPHVAPRAARGAEALARAFTCVSTDDVAGDRWTIWER